MKKCLVVLFISIMVFSAGSTAYALVEPVEKLKSGVVEFVSSPLGFVTHTSEQVDESESKLFGLVSGLIMGADHMLRHSISGMVDILTFPVSDLY